MKMKVLSMPVFEGVSKYIRMTGILSVSSKVELTNEGNEITEYGLERENEKGLS